MSAARNAEDKCVTSIARAINWSYMWRRLMSYVWLDLLLVVMGIAFPLLGAALLVGLLMYALFGRAQA